ncbi:MAG: hypothetical protein JWN98_1319 [Abditibacteriota bacterium]|nr:hypothetical protein [Abditibacteriota bacterium]
MSSSFTSATSATIITAKKRKPTVSAPVSPPKYAKSVRHERLSGRIAGAFSLRSVLLWLFIALGISLRFVGMTWDEAHQLHPDERFLTMTVPTLSWPQTIAEYFETRSATLNPFNNNVNFFIYGQLPLTLAKAVATVFHCDDYDGIRIVGRTLSALFDAGSVLLLFFIGRRLAGATVGLVSAALLAFTVLNIQQSHFFVVDTFATFFLMAAFLCALRWFDAWPQASISDQPSEASVTAPERILPHRRRAVANAVACGFFWGASMACKIPCALFILVVFGFALALWWRISRQAKVEQQTSSDVVPQDAHNASKVLWKRARWSVVTTSLLLILTGFVWFRVLHPVAFEGSASPATLWGFLDIRPAADGIGSSGQEVGFWKSFRDTADIASGRQDLPWNLQWIGQPKIWFSLRNLLIWAIGWPVVVAAIGGILLILGQFVLRKSVPLGLVSAAAWNILIFLYYSTTYMKYTRYYLMITPFVALCAAWFGAQLWRWAQSRTAPEAGPQQRRLRGLPVSALAALALNGIMLNTTALWALACASIYVRPHPRLEASRWMRENLAPNAVIAFESVWDDVVPVGGTGGFQMLDLRLYDHDTPEKRENFLTVLGHAQYIIVTSNRVWGSVPRLPQRWPLTTTYYHALFDGELGFRPAQEWTNYPQLNLFGWVVKFPDDTIEESLSVYDHPRVVLFEKTPHFSHTEVEQILDSILVGQRDDAPLSDYIQSGWAPDESTLPWLPSVTHAK